MSELVYHADRYAELDIVMLQSQIPILQESCERLSISVRFTFLGRKPALHAGSTFIPIFDKMTDFHEFWY
jgi:hypothetical protein